MYINKDKILGHGVNRHGRPFVVIRSADFPNDPSLRRSTYVSTVNRATDDGKVSEFSNSGTPADDSYVAVEVDKLRDFHPVWCLTEGDLLAQYTAKQRDDEENRRTFDYLVRTTKVNIFRDPTLKAKASELWSAQVAMTIAK